MSKTHKIAILAGDGIGPEVVQEGLRVLAAASDQFDFSYELTDYPYGTDHWLATGGENGGEIFPDEAFAEAQQHDALLLGAIGDPRAPVGLIERGVIGKLRWEGGLYINLRPIKLSAERWCPLKDKTPADVDMVIIRENTEDAYVFPPEFTDKGGPNETASQPMKYTRMGTERVIRYAFEVAMTRPRKQLTLIDKANAVRAQDIYTRVFDEVSKEYPEVKTDHAYIDAACMWMVKNPEWFDTAVTTNLFGDIITDLGAMVQGGMGVAASGNINPGHFSLFEPIHGSMPKATGKNTANPVATVNAVAMMLEHLGENEAAAAIESAVERLLQSDRVKGLKAGVHSTSEWGDMVLAELNAAVNA
ncbi:MAG: 3-isopropylmalate dehydrogenase [Planctomycetes bacterium]|jgi:3-isopropylmalate dehydrogenase|nr:3-isopropylmalate dehydrogenase [Planctomycetota bacterium]MBT4027917.1 3-isopropylmalate dehydrogenase [Planctomycetota bacterium]MBT4560032.1 3-isopropylmalate dehydrogenase [Planctomycetota bacterium]MBT5100458.1 3-isopropylmalate dehydrogenase [Planctomycetota bacterium]MBT5119192.1 3-isopropylmalate dehydrogenase [Planctomycetota bacterium]